MPKKSSNKIMMVPIPVQKRSLGGTLGRFAGGLGSMFLPIPGISGGDLGEYLGKMTGLKRGGVRTRRRGGK